MAPRRKGFLVSLVVLVSIIIVMGLVYYIFSSRGAATSEPIPTSPVSSDEASPSAPAQPPEELHDASPAPPPASAEPSEPPGLEGGTPGDRPHQGSGATQP